MNLWMEQYGDNHADTNKFFDNLDANRDHQLAEADIVAQLSELGRMYLVQTVCPRQHMYIMSLGPQIPD